MNVIHTKGPFDSIFGMHKTEKTMSKWCSVNYEYANEGLGCFEYDHMLPFAVRCYF